MIVGHFKEAIAFLRHSILKHVGFFKVFYWQAKKINKRRGKGKNTFLCLSTLMQFQLVFILDFCFFSQTNEISFFVQMFWQIMVVLL